MLYKFQINIQILRLEQKLKISTIYHGFIDGRNYYS